MNEETTSKEQLGFLLHPANLLKTLGSQFPIASALVEVQNQISGYEYGKRIDSLEEGVLLAAKIQALEAANPPIPAPLYDWSASVSEFTKRTVDVAVAHAKGWRTGNYTGKELVLPVAHACIIDALEILICKEALDLASAIAAHSGGRIVILAGMAWHEVKSVPDDDDCGLLICELAEKDEKRWESSQRAWREAGLDLPLEANFSRPLRFSPAMWMGQEVAFIHSGEAADVMGGEHSFTNRQIDTAVISHFRKPRKNDFKVGVTGVLPGRILSPGSPVFGRDGTLLGILADTESYESDAGRRAVIRSLLGHPRFTHPAKA